MNHALHEHLCQQLDEQLQKRSVVVFYDPRGEFGPFFDRELPEVGTGYDGLPRVIIRDRLTFVARFQGSFLALRAAIEPIAAQDKPEPLIVYVAGPIRDRLGSVLMELEKGGTCYEPHLKRLALNVLRRRRFSDGQIDEILKPANVTYDDIVSFLRQGDDDQPASRLRTIFEERQSEAMLAGWLASDEHDEAIAEKDAIDELLKLIDARIGLALPTGMPVADARSRTLRYVLVGEFRSDLTCEPPPSIAMVPMPPSKDHVERVRDVAQLLRTKHADRYPDLAGGVETGLGLRDTTIDAGHLGSIDTFQFEERRLLRHGGDLVAAKQYGQALDIVAGRNRSFWVDRDLLRQKQWEAVRLAAELGQEVERVRGQLAKASPDPAKWVAAYSADGGWSRVDTAQRRLETWVASMEEEPENDTAVAVVRREHYELLKRMAEGFSGTLRSSCWTVPGVLHQTRVYPEVVRTMGGRVAYFMVDALRFEMGAELRQHFEGAQDLTLRPAITALPSITPVGMAALLPGASASFSVVDHKGKLAARIETTPLPALADRVRFLKAKVPDAVELTLGKVLSTPVSKLGKLVESASLVVVRSQEIDFVGESDGDSLARQVMDTVIGSLARAVRKLASVGIESFVVTADHGHQFSLRKEEDMRTDNPGGDTLDLHRRCWIGRGGTTPTGTVRVAGTDLGYDTNLEFVFPTGLGVFKAGGGLAFHHGGFSLQELIVPVLSLRIPARSSKPPSRQLVGLDDVPERITNRTFGVRVVLSGGQIPLDNALVRVKVLLLSGGEDVGKTGMALGGELDRETGVLTAAPGSTVSVGLMLAREGCERVRIVVVDPETDAMLVQSDEIPVKLGI